MRMTETGWPTGGSRNFAGHDANIDLGARCVLGILCVWWVFCVYMCGCVLVDDRPVEGRTDPPTLSCSTSPPQPPPIRPPHTATSTTGWAGPAAPRGTRTSTRPSTCGRGPAPTTSRCVRASVGAGGSVWGVVLVLVGVIGVPHPLDIAQPQKKRIITNPPQPNPHNPTNRHSTLGS